MTSKLVEWLRLMPAMVVAGMLVGCGGHTARTLPMRTALDAGDPQGAIGALDHELKVKAPSDMPKHVEGDNALFILDRGSIEQSLAHFPDSRHDFEVADKAIDMLDLSSNAADTIGRYVFSDSAGRYKAPPYEKLLINTLNMINYLETQDLPGARVEARRLAVMMTYFHDKLVEPNPVLGLGGFLAGLTYEKTGGVDEALRYYDEALALGRYDALHDSVRALVPQGSYRSPRLNAIASEAPPPPSLDDAGQGEIVLVVGYGRVPHKVSNRLPIGLALTLISGALSPRDYARANRIAADGLVTWVNFPSLAKEEVQYQPPSCALDGQPVVVEEAVNVTSAVRAQWKKIEGHIIVAAVTRMIARFAVGVGIQAAAGRDSIIGLVASLGTQAGLSALDTPDTRSWETLPARVAVARFRVTPGHHELVLQARGVTRRAAVEVSKGGWALVSLMALR